MILKGDRIELRPVTVADVNDRYLNWMNDIDVTRYLEVRFSPQTHETIHSYVEKMIEKDDEKFFAICLIETGSHLGNIKLGPIHPHHRSADVSLFIGEKSWWGKGIATEAISLVTRYAFESLKLSKLRAGVYAANESSARAFENCSWKREGLLRSQVVCDGRAMDVILLGIPASDFHKGER